MRKKKKITFGIMSVTALIVVGMTGYFIYSLNLLTGIENLLRAIIMIAAGGILLLILLGLFVLSKKKKKKVFTLLVCFTLLYSFGLYFGASNIDRIIGKIENITTDTTTYSTSLVALSSNELDDIKNLDSGVIGILSDETNVEGNVLPNEVIKDLKIKNEVKKYDSFVTLIKALLEEEIDYAFLPTNYSILFGNIEGFDKLKEQTKIIYTKSKEEKQKKERKSNGSKLDKPFTILLMGVDSDIEEIKGSSFNGDSLMLITFNPTTLNSTIVSIPRDSYVPITCFTGQRKNKITHAAWYGEGCMIDTIENFLDVHIDYYAKINFKGVVKLVDALGGVDVDVEYSFCEQDSNRSFGENTVYVKEGFQTLNGEAALAYARNRHPNPEYCSSEWTNYDSNDFIRGQHQQDVVKALMNKFSKIDSLDTFYDILDTISNSMETNLSTSEILSLYDIAKDVLLKSRNMPLEDLFGIQRLYISGYDYYIYDYHPASGQGSQMSLYDFVPYKGSIQDVSNAMKVNLGLKEAEVIKSFSFDVDDEYEETVIGRKNYGEGGIPLMRDFTGVDVSVARSYANVHGISLIVEEIDSPSIEGLILDQSIPEGTDLEYVSTLKVYVSNGSGGDDPVDPSEGVTDCSKKENATNSVCAMPTFIGDTVGFVKTWFKNQGYDINVEFSPSGETDSAIVTGQSTTNAYLYDYIGTDKVFTIEWEEKKEEPVEPEEPEEPENPDNPDNSNE